MVGEWVRRSPGAVIRTGRRSRSGRGRAGSIRGAEAMRDAARRRCGPGKGADRTGRRRTARSGPRGARRARCSGAHAAKPQPAETSRDGRSGRKARGKATEGSFVPLAWGRECRGHSAPGMPAGMGSRAGGGEGGSYPAEPTSAARPPRGRPGARPGIRGRATVARAGRRMERWLHIDWNRSSGRGPRRTRPASSRRGRRSASSS